jgi:methyl-accepting chemotaxis protein
MWRIPTVDFRPTKYSDVCATLDELKETFAKDPDRLQREPEAIASLFEDIRYMLARMHRRLEEYQRLADSLAALADEMRAIPDENLRGARERLSRLQGMADDPDSAVTRLEQMNALAEQVRDVANHQEQLLREHKALWIRVFRLYQQVKGSRNWSEEEAQQE